MPLRKTPPIPCFVLTALCLTLFTSDPAAAGLHYRFTQDGDQLSPDDGEVWIDGDRTRVRWRRETTPFVFDLEISHGDAWTRLHTGDATWFDQETEATVEAANRELPGPVRHRARKRSLVSQDSYFSPVVPFAPFAVRYVEVTPVASEPGPTVAGFPATRHAFHISYLLEQVVGQEYIQSKVRATLEVWTTDALDRRPLPVDPGDFATGIEKVDEVLGPHLVGLPGFPLRRIVTVSRQVSDTWPLSGSHTLSLEQIEDVPVPEERFVVPPHFTEWVPRMAQARPLSEP